MSSSSSNFLARTASPRLLAAAILSVSGLLAALACFGLPALAEKDAPQRYYRSTELDASPGIKTHVTPEYPGDALLRSISGTAVIRLFIDQTGAVERVDVLRSEPPGVFGASSQRAFQAARFTPGMKSGRPVKSQVTLEIKFELPQ